MKKFLLALIAPLALGFTACTEDENPDFCINPDAQPRIAYVLNQGSMYSGIDGTMDILSLVDSAYQSNAFAAINGQSLGDTPQAGIIYGSKLYVAMYGSNRVWVLDRQTLRALGSIPTKEPEGICASEGSIYVSNNDGFVSRIDTTQLKVTAQMPVGPNPQHMLAVGRKVYVSISDGYNYANNYKDGFRVVELDGLLFEKMAEYQVGMNPGPLAADVTGNIYVACRGNYGDVAPKVWRIQGEQASEFCDGSDVEVCGDRLYVVNNYTNYSVTPAETILTYKVYNTTTSQCINSALLEGQPQPEAPIFLDINPQNGDLYIGSNASASDYTSPGFLWHYNAEGQFIGKQQTGVAPCAVIF